MVATWQQDYLLSELDFNLSTPPRFFSPSLLKKLRKKAQAQIDEIEQDEGDDVVMDSDDSDDSESDDDDQVRG